MKIKKNDLKLNNTKSIDVQDLVLVGYPETRLKMARVITEVLSHHFHTVGTVCLSFRTRNEEAYWSCLCDENENCKARSKVLLCPTRRLTSSTGVHSWPFQYSLTLGDLSRNYWV
ncbi:hypothetical protein RRG08_024070 [Elysia crispata]|uniref:Uncharacterized protein n=1 Tax=Elysia crispata TaxID=231223 RepID=A0AAE0ZP52_9GAST|nr:hypothetical protein RRG08_024070 [Elysia crispata]